MNVLLCEDDKGIQELITLLLENEGYKVATSTNSRDASELIHSLIYNLIIIDYWLEDGMADGLIGKIRKELPSIPIILISAAGNLEELSIKLRVNDYLQKPFDIITLQSKVNQLIHDNHNRSN